MEGPLPTQGVGKRRAIHDFERVYSIRFKNRPVWLAVTLATCSGVPWAMI